jgi:hypothetical protein
MVPVRETMFPFNSVMSNNIGSDLAADERASIASTAAAKVSAAIPVRAFEETSVMFFLRACGRYRSSQPASVSRTFTSMQKQVLLPTTDPLGMGPKTPMGACISD